MQKKNADNSSEPLTEEELRRATEALEKETKKLLTNVVK